MSKVLQELPFSQQSKTLPWLPDDISDYSPWTDRHTAGTFTVAGERYAFLRLSEQEGYFHVWISLLPEGTEPHEVRIDEEAAKSWLREYMLTRDRRNVVTYQGELNAGFFYGVRYCKPCIICGAELATIDTTSEDIAEQPSGGINFTSHGHYGSAVFDPMNASHLSVNFCDPCLREKARDGLITHVQEHKRTVDESRRTDFDPDQGD